MGEILVQSWSPAPSHSIIEYTTIYLFIILVSGLLGCFQFAAILNNAVVAILFFMSPGAKRPGFLRVGTSCIFSVQFSHSVMSDSLHPHGLQHSRLPCPSSTSGVYSNSCPLSRWCHPTISSSAVLFSSHLHSFPASRSFQMSQFFVSGGQNIGVSASASVLPMNTQDWFPLGWTGCISLQSKGFSRVFSNTTVQKHQFFSTQLSLLSNSHIHTWLLEKP